MEAVKVDSSKTTLIVGATDNPSRYAYTAAGMLADLGMEFIPIGIKKGTVFGIEILDLKTKPPLKNIHTITLYIGSANQPEWISYLIGLQPKRIIFNPGTENPDFITKASAAGIEALTACNLVMLRTGQF